MPTILRGVKFIAWAKVLTSPCIDIYNREAAYRSSNLYILRHTSQVVYILSVLNDAFDDDLRRIRIVNSTDIDPIYTYRTPELKPKFIYKTAEHLAVNLFNDAEVQADINGFIIQVPAAVAALPVYDINRLKALVDKYRLTSKNKYIINIV